MTTRIAPSAKGAVATTRRSKRSAVASNIAPSPGALAVAGTGGGTPRPAAADLKPRLATGQPVYAAWWPDRARKGPPTWHPGVVQAAREVEAGGQYGPLRLYDVQYDDGDALADIEDAYVMSAGDYLLTMKAAEEGAGWIGVENVVDVESEDGWASTVGWYKANIDGQEQLFAHLSDALRSYDASVVQAKGTATNPSELNLPFECEVFSTSSFKGVRYLAANDKYQVSISWNRKNYYLGVYRLASDAAYGYHSAAAWVASASDRERQGGGATFANFEHYRNTRAVESQRRGIRDVDFDDMQAAIALNVKRATDKMAKAAKKPAKKPASKPGRPKKTPATPVASYKITIPVVSEEKVATEADERGEAETKREPGVLTHALFGTAKISDERLGDTSDGKSLVPIDSLASAAPVPFNAINDDWARVSPLAQELAWLFEESKLLLPVDDTFDGMQLPLVLDVAWENGSALLHKMLLAYFPYEMHSVLNALKNASSTGATLSVVDANTLLLQEDRASFSLDVFNSLRDEARDGLRLGYRRSRSIELRLNGIAVGKQPRPGVPKKKKNARLRNGDIVMSDNNAQPSTIPASSTSSQSIGSTAATEMDAVAWNVPSELNELEEEVAWLVEESLIFQPPAAVGDAPLSTQSDQPASIVVSSGPVTAAEIDWQYVLSHASGTVKSVLTNARRRPLQRLVRQYDKEVRLSFESRRNEIFSLLLGGYRRAETQDALPSHEYLVQTGRAHILEVRRSRYQKFSGMPTQEAAHAKDISSACKQRLGDITNSPRKRKATKKGASTPASCSKKLKMTIVEV